MTWWVVAIFASLAAGMSWKRDAETDRRGNPCICYLGVRWFFPPLVLFSFIFFLYLTANDTPGSESESYVFLACWTAFCAFALYYFRPLRISLLENEIEFWRWPHTSIRYPLVELEDVVAEDDGTVKLVFSGGRRITATKYMSGRKQFVERLHARQARVIGKPAEG
jgi:hypothetical protein